MQLKDRSSKNFSIDRKTRYLSLHHISSFDSQLLRVTVSPVPTCLVWGANRRPLWEVPVWHLAINPDNTHQKMGFLNFILPSSQGPSCKIIHYCEDTLFALLPPTVSLCTMWKSFGLPSKMFKNVFSLINFSCKS